GRKRHHTRTPRGDPRARSGPEVIYWNSNGAAPPMASISPPPPPASSISQRESVSGLSPRQFDSSCARPGTGILHLVITIKWASLEPG
ncbi:MAG: hypothetical protein ACXVBY_14910, partial [Isosphaeraceae bacterium]